MSTTVDQRVVEMRFDNQHFEKNVSTTMSTLDKLKQKLHLPGAVKGLEDVSKSAKKVDLSDIGKSADKVGLRFSAMYTMADQVFRNITNSAYTAGKRIVSALTIDPVKTGFNEYELKMGSIQTIMASTGESLDTVNSYLNQLNEYSDKTIYSFSDMTQNIGKFTNAGVKLKDAVAAIQGVSNVAAVSGANANEASRAMYNFAQALSAGYVKLIDWKSIENANMATVEFKNYLLEAAAAAGTLTKTGDGMYKTLGGDVVTATRNFNESLQEQWMTTDVLISVLRDYSSETTDIGKKATAAAQDVKTLSQLFDTLKESAQSGWAQTWELIVGDFEESKKLFTNLSKKIGGFIEGMSEARNKFLGGALKSKWEQMTDKIEEAGGSAEKFGEILTETAKEAGIPIDNLVKKHGSLEKAFRHIKNPTEIITKALKKMMGTEDDLANATGKVTGKIEDLDKIVRKVINGEFGNGQTRIEKLTEAGYDYATVQNKVNETLGVSYRHVVKLTDEQKKNADSLSKLSDEQLKSAGYTDEQIEALRELDKAAKDGGTSINELIENMTMPSGRELLFDSFANLWEAIKVPLNSIREAWNETFGDSLRSDSLYDVLDSLHELTEKVEISEEAADNFKTIWEGIFAAFQLGHSVFSMSVVGALKILSAVLEVFGTDLVGVASYVANLIIKFRDWVKENTVFIGHWKKIGEVIAAVIKAIDRIIDAFMELAPVQELIASITDTVKGWFDVIGKGIAAGNLDNWIKKINEWADSAVNWVRSLQNVENLPMAIAQGIGKALGKALAFVRDTFSSMFAYITGGFTSMPGDITSGFVGGLWNGIKNVASAIWNFASMIITTACDVLGIRSPSTVFIAIGAFIVAGLLVGITQGWSGLENLVKSLFGQLSGVVKQVVEGINLGNIFSVAMAGGVVFAAKKIYDLASRFAKVAEALIAPLAGLGRLFSGLGKAFDNLGDYIKARTWNQKTKAIKDVAIAIGILAASLWILSKIPAEDIWRALNALVGLVIVIIVLAATINKMGDVQGEFAKLGFLFISLGAAMLLMSFAIKQMDFITKDNWYFVLGGMVVMLGGLMGVTAVIGKLVKGKTAQNIDKAGAMFRKLAWTLLLLAVAIKIIGTLTPDELTKGIKCIGLFGTFLVAMILVSKYAGNKINSVGKAMLAISAGVLLMAATIKLISTMTPTELTKGIVCITLFGGIVVGLIAATKLMGKDIEGIGGAILGVSAAIAILALTSKLFAKMSIAELAKGIVCIALFGAIAVGLIAATKLAGEGQLVKAGLSVLLLSFAIGVIAATGVVLGLVPLENLAKGIVAVSMLGAMMALLIHATKGAADAKKNITAMTVAIGVMAAAVLLLSSIEDTSKLAASVAALSILMGVFALMVKMTGQAGEFKKCIGTLVTLTVIVGGLGFLIWCLRDVDAESAVGSAIGISVLLGALMGALAILSNLKIDKTNITAALIALAVLAAELVGLTWLLSTVPPLQNSISTIAALTVVLGALSGLVAIATLVGKVVKKDIGSAVAGIAGLAVMIGALWLLGFAISKIPDISHSNETIITLTGVLAALSVILLLTAAVGAIYMATGGVAIIGLLGLVAMIFMLSGLADAVSKMPDTSAGLENVKGVMELMTALTDLLVKLAIIGPFALIGITAMYGITQFMIAIGGMAAAIGALMKIKMFSSLETFLDTGLGLLKKLAQGIGEIVSAFADGLASRFPNIAANLSDFMDKLGLFIEGAKQVDGKVAKATAILVGAILGFTAASFIDGIAKLSPLSTSLAELGAQLSLFMINALPFIILSKSIDSAVCEGVKTLAEMMIILTAANVLDGLTRWFTGGNSLAKFGAELALFGPWMKKYADAVKGINAKTVKGSAEAAERLAKMAASLPNSGGLAGFFAGENDMALFGANLVVFGRAIKRYSKAVKDLDTSSINKSVSAAKNIASFANMLPTTGGLWGWLYAGDNDMATFGRQLVSFGRAIKRYSKAVKDLDTSSINKSVSAAKNIASFANMLPDTGGLWGYLAGDNNMGSFGINLAVFGKALKSYSDSVVGIDTEAIGNSINATNRLIGLSNRMPEDKGIFGPDNMGAFRDNLSKLGYGLWSYSGYVVNVDTNAVSTSINNANRLIGMIKQLANLDTSGVSAFSTAIDDLAKVNITGIKEAFNVSIPDFASVGTSIVTAIASGINSGSYTVIGAAAQLVTALVQGFMNGYAQAVAATNMLIVTMHMVIAASFGTFESAGSSIIAKLASGISKQKASISTYMNTTMSAMVDNIENFYSDFYDAGNYVVEGLAAGIDENTFKVEAQARAMALAALEAAKEALGIHSPSVDFEEEVGYFSDLGAAIGITKYTPIVEKAASDMAIAAKTAAQKEFDDTTAGYYMDQRAALGITSHVPAAEKAGEEAGKAAAEAVINGSEEVAEQEKEGLLSKVLGFFKPKNAEEEGEEVGSAFGEGVSSGASAGASAGAKQATEEVAKAIYDADLGRWIVENISAGITSDMSAEEAAAKKAQNITDAFKTELDKVDRDIKTADLEYDLWESKNPNASEAERDAKKIELLNEKVAIQKQKTLLAESEYLETRNNFTEDSEETQEAYNTWLEEQTTLAGLMNDITDVQNEAIERNKESFEKAQEAAKALKEAKSARPDLDLSKWEAMYGNDASDAEKTVAELYTIAKNIPHAITALGDAKKAYADALADPTKTAAEIEEAYNDVITAETNLAQLMSDATKTHTDALNDQLDAQKEYDELVAQWKTIALNRGISEEDFEKWARDETGFDPKALESLQKINTTELAAYVKDIISESNLVGAVDPFAQLITEIVMGKKSFGDALTEFAEVTKDGLDTGIQNGTPGATTAVTELSETCTEAIAAEQPNFVEAGKQAITAFAQGMRDGANIAVEAANDVATKTVAAIRTALEPVMSILNGDTPLTPRICPIMDMNSIHTDIASMNTMFAHSTASMAGINATLSGDGINLIQTVNTSNAEVVRAISELRGDFGNLVSAINGMQIRMDSGTVVGELIGKIDNQLGQIANHKGRGN